MIRRTGAAALCALVLTGCVSQPRITEAVDSGERAQALLALQKWSLSGRIGLKVEDRGFSGALQWHQDGDQLHARFHGPLGAGAFQISGHPGELILHASDGEQYYLDQPEAVLQQQLGWSVPIDAMRFWLLGVAYPEWPATYELGADGNLAHLQQRDWNIVYERYHAGEIWPMPRKLVMTSGDITARVAVQNWTLGAKALAD